VHRTVRRHSPPGGDERLAGHLAAEDALQVLVGAAASEDVDLDPFQVEELDEHALRGHIARSFDVSPLPLPLYGRVPADLSIPASCDTSGRLRSRPC
jgi:hypothetical protein